MKTIWLQDIYRYAAENVAKILVGNKYDIAYLRQVEKEAAQVKIVCLSLNLIVALYIFE